MANQLVLNRLAAIQQILGRARSGGVGMSSPAIGAESEAFIGLVLNNIIAPPFRIGTGQITDHSERSSGQVDIVIEYSSSISFPLLMGSTARLYPSEGVCAVIEVKSNLSSQWQEVLAKAELVHRLHHDPGAVGSVGRVPDHIPFFAVGYGGWSNPSTVAHKLSDANAERPILDGLLVIEPGVYRARKDDYTEHDFDGPAALYGFLLSLEQLTSTMIGAKPSLRP